VAPRGVVDLYTLRCAVAVLVHARRHVDVLDDRQLIRVNQAVGHLSQVADDLHGDLATATRWLLSPDPDPRGARTVRAITRLAALTHVDDAAAPALAASLQVAAKPVQASLFDAVAMSEASA
jgi:hypothetical protein